MQKLTVLVITHKDYEFPDSACYRPLFVGGKIASGLKNEGFYQDNSGVNIAEKNSSFCELTGLYWAWKNGVFENNEYVGLVHYRRYFAGKALDLKKKQIASESELLTILEKYDTEANDEEKLHEPAPLTSSLRILRPEAFATNYCFSTQYNAFT